LRAAARAIALRGRFLAYDDTVFSLSAVGGLIRFVSSGVSGVEIRRR
jgi:hypothetical protein